MTLLSWLAYNTYVGNWDWLLTSHTCIYIYVTFHFYHFKLIWLCVPCISSLQWMFIILLYITCTYTGWYMIYIWPVHYIISVTLPGPSCWPVRRSCWGRSGTSVCSVLLRYSSVCLSVCLSICLYVRMCQFSMCSISGKCKGRNLTHFAAVTSLFTKFWFLPFSLSRYILYTMHIHTRIHGLRTHTHAHAYM